MPGFESVEHFAIVIGLLATSFGLWRGMRAWRAERQAAARARMRHEELLDEVLAEFRGPDSIKAQVSALSDMLEDHVRRSAEVWEDNSRAHTAIHRRIDHLYEVLPNAGYRRLAEQHRQMREGEDQGDE